MEKLSEKETPTFRLLNIREEEEEMETNRDEIAGFLKTRNLHTQNVIEFPYNTNFLVHTVKGLNAQYGPYSSVIASFRDELNSDT